MSENRFQVLTTAAEAWPVFEDIVFHAKQDVIAGFRIFDLSTRLRNEAVRNVVGTQWIDLFAHVLLRGVKINITICDFDPVMGTELHRSAWRSMRQAAALREMVGPDAARNLSFEAHLHPARAGVVSRAILSPIVTARRAKEAAQLSTKERQREAPGLRDDGPDFRTTTHHQKLAVIDSHVLYVGGLDLNERRWDTPKHEIRAEQSWSDLQVLTTGTPAQEARQHLLEFRNVVHGDANPSKFQHIARTLAGPRKLQAPFLSPKTILNEIEQMHLDGFAEAQHLIYIETQYLRSEVIAKGLAKAARQNADVRLIVVMPGLPDDVAFEGNSGMDAAYGLEREENAHRIISQAFQDRAVFAVPVQPSTVARVGDASLSGSPLIHVHNKLLVLDDRFAAIGSANLNGRSMRWDTEVALRIEHPDQVDQVRRASRDHWFGPNGVPEHHHSVERQFDWWAAEIRKNQVRLPENRAGFLVPYDPEIARKRGQALPGITENLV